MLVEACSLFINRITTTAAAATCDDCVYARRSASTNKNSPAPGPVMLIHREPAKKGDRNDRIGREFL